MTKKPIFLIRTEGKTAEQIADEAWEALQRYRDAQQDAKQQQENDDEMDDTEVARREAIAAQQGMELPEEQ
jgi:hypothetical protein